MSLLLSYIRLIKSSLSFFFNHTATTQIYTLSLHDALPISIRGTQISRIVLRTLSMIKPTGTLLSDRKSTRLNSSHVAISYAVFCLKKKKKITKMQLDNQKETDKTQNETKTERAGMQHEKQS